MRSWGKRSQRVFDTLDVRLQRVMNYVLHHVADVSLISGYRDEAEQNHLYATGKSQLRYPLSKHNESPSKAVDFQPYPMPQREEKLWAALAYVAGSAKEYARGQGVSLRWGGNWSRNGDLTENTFDDLFHLEIVD